MKGCDFMIIFLTTYLLIGVTYLVYSFIKAETIFRFNKDITEMLSYHDWFGVLCVILIMLLWMFLGILVTTTWPIFVIGSVVMVSINKICKSR